MSYKFWTHAARGEDVSMHEASGVTRSRTGAGDSSLSDLHRPARLYPTSTRGPTALAWNTGI